MSSLTDDQRDILEIVAKKFLDSVKTIVGKPTEENADLWLEAIASVPVTVMNFFAYDWVSFDVDGGRLTLELHRDTETIQDRKNIPRNK